MPNLSRRSFVSTAAVLPALAVPPAIAVASVGPDPIFAAIDTHQRAEHAHNEAAGRYFDAEEDFVNEFGASTPDAITKKQRAKLTDLDRYFATARLDTHERVTQLKTRAGFPMGMLGRLHRELNRQTAAFNQRVEPLRLATSVAGDQHIQATVKLMSTTPTTPAGLAALAKYLREKDDTQLDYYLDGEGSCLRHFLDLVGTSALAFA
jgi:uncharacterized protein with LGFP repeats